MARAAKANPTSAQERLAKYREKRDFARTAEPSGATEPTAETDLSCKSMRHRGFTTTFDLNLTARWSVGP